MKEEERKKSNKYDGHVIIVFVSVLIIMGIIIINNLIRGYEYISILKTAIFICFLLVILKNKNKYISKGNHE